MIDLKAIKQRFAHRSAAEVVRAASLRVWPLSTATHAYYGLRFWPPVWGDVLNRRARRAYREERQSLDAIQQRIVDELLVDGISSLSIGDLFADPRAFERLAVAAAPFLERREVQSQIDAGVSVGRRGKYFVIRAFDEQPVLDLDNPLMGLPIHVRILSIVNAYFGMWSRLKSMDLWVNLPVDDASQAAGSQIWHRDYEDRQLLKIFVYLSDVDEDAGPLSFVRTSHTTGALGHIFPRHPPIGSVPPPGEVERVVSPSLMTTCTVPAGTIVFCDTSGLHKGGRCLKKRRTAFTATFATNGAIDPDRYDLPPNARTRSLSPAVRHALGMG